MINAQVINFWKGVNLETGASVSKVTLRLPGGLEVESEVPEGYLPVLLEAASPSEPSAAAVAAAAPQRVVHQTPTAPAEIEEPEEPEEAPAMQENVDWGSLPEEVLPNIVKYAFKDQGLPDRMPAEKVFQIRDAFLAEYTEDDWNSIIRKYSAPEGGSTEVLPEEAHAEEEQAPPPVAPVRPRKAQVEWGEGAVMSPSVPSRTVPKDNMGYPVVQRNANEVDPGELAAGDEDGVEDF